MARRKVTEDATIETAVVEDPKDVVVDVPVDASPVDEPATVEATTTIEAAPTVVEAAPVEDAPKPKKTRKTTAKTEDAAEEKTPVTKKKVDETPIFGIKKPDEDQKPIMAKTSAPVVSDSTIPYKARVSAALIYSKKGPGMGYSNARGLRKGTIVSVSEVIGNWGRISHDTWININFIEKV